MATAKNCGDPQEAETVTLKNGKRVTIRPVCPSDDELEKDLFEHLSPESRRDRFLGGSCKVTRKLLKQLTENDHQQHEAFIAVACDDEESEECRAVGVAHYALDRDGHSCECAVVVNDDWQHQGLGRKLVQRLIDAARGHDLDTIYSIDSAENQRYNHLARSMGFESSVDPHDYTLVTYSLNLNPEMPVGEAVHGKRNSTAAKNKRA